MSEQGSALDIIGRHLEETKFTVGTMESLTGGLLSSALTDTHDCSCHFIGGVVSYSEDLKAYMGVPREVMERYGIISEETARAMAHAIRESLGTDIGIGITGVAGPGEQEGKPAGTVHIAIEGPYGVLTGRAPREEASEQREENKMLSVEAALELFRQYLDQGEKR